MDHLTYQHDTSLGSMCEYSDMPNTLTRPQVRRLLLDRGALDGDWIEFISEFGDHTTYSTEQVKAWLGH